MDPITIGVLIICGFLFLFNGFRLHRQLIALTGAIVGGYLGAGLAMRLGLPVLAGAPAGAILLGVAAWFATAWSVAAGRLYLRRVLRGRRLVGLRDGSSAHLVRRAGRRGGCRHPLLCDIQD